MSLTFTPKIVLPDVAQDLVDHVYSIPKIALNRHLVTMGVEDFWSPPTSANISLDLFDDVTIGVLVSNIGMLPTKHAEAKIYIWDIGYSISYAFELIHNGVEWCGSDDEEEIGIVMLAIGQSLDEVIVERKEKLEDMLKNMEPFK